MIIVTTKRSKECVRIVRIVLDLHGVTVDSKRVVPFEYEQPVIRKTTTTTTTTTKNKQKTKTKNKSYLLYGRECFTEKFTTRKIHTNLHPGQD